MQLFFNLQLQASLLYTKLPLRKGGCSLCIEQLTLYLHGGLLYISGNVLFHYLYFRPISYLIVQFLKVLNVFWLQSIPMCFLFLFQHYDFLPSLAGEECIHSSYNRDIQWDQSSVSADVGCTKSNNKREHHSILYRWW